MCYYENNTSENWNKFKKISFKQDPVFVLEPLNKAWVRNYWHNNSETWLRHKEMTVNSRAG